MEQSTTKPQINTYPQEYNWLERHKLIIEENKNHPDMIFIGDSITHYFGGNPKDSIVRGGEVWNTYYAHRNPVNMGCGWDRTQHILWRLDHGAIDNIEPKVAVVLAGTNNVLWENNSAKDIAAGIREIIIRLNKKLPKTKILLIGILPFGEEPDDEKRGKIKNINEIMSGYSNNKSIYFVDIGKLFLFPDGRLIKEFFIDNLHPNQYGYEIYAKAIEPIIRQLLCKIRLKREQCSTGAE